MDEGFREILDQDPSDEASEYSEEFMGNSYSGAFPRRRIKVVAGSSPLSRDPSPRGRSLVDSEQKLTPQVLSLLQSRASITKQRSPVSGMGGGAIG